MKLITLLSALFFSTLSFANSNIKEMDFWDGTFAYNRLTVKEVPFQSNLITLELTGSTIALGPQIEGLDQTWGVNDKILVTIRKSDCSTLNFDKKIIKCNSTKTSGLISWNINPRVTKSLDTIFENINVEAKAQDRLGVDVLVEVELPSDEFFTPVNELLRIDFKSLSF